MKIFVKGVVDEKGIMTVQYEHFAPLDPDDGLDEDILKTGYLTEAEHPDMSTDNTVIKTLLYDTVNDKFIVNEVQVTPPMTTDEKVDLLIQMMLESEGIL